MSTERAYRERAGTKVVDSWNDANPVGTPVRYWAGLREGDGVESATRSKASLLGGHTPVVWVEGRPDCIALTHVERVAGHDDCNAHRCSVHGPGRDCCGRTLFGSPGEVVR